MSYEQYLAVFQESLEIYGLSPKRIERHVSHLEHFLVDYLENTRHKEFGSSVRELDAYLKNIKKDPQEVRELIKSFNLFYRVMHERGYISSQLYAVYEWLVKENTIEWTNKGE